MNLYDIKYSNIPMADRNAGYVLDFLKKHPSRIRYRGKSIKGIYKRAPYHCIKQYATSFTIYPR